MNLADTIQMLFNDIGTTVNNTAQFTTIMAVIVLSLIFIGSDLSVIRDWKENYPESAKQVIKGLLFVVFTSFIITLISFN
jgi:hypothetical protein